MKLLNEANLVYFSTCGSQTTKEGWLSKRGEVNKSFQKRWFVLKGNLLFYFEKPGEGSPSGVIILEGYTVELADTAGTDGWAFQIVFHGAANTRKYILQAESQQVMDDWMKCITRASYQYMKVIVNELKAQLDELNAQELSMELQGCKTRDRTALDPFGHEPFSGQASRNAGAASTSFPGQTTRINPFDTHSSSAQPPADAESAGLFESSGDHLDAFGQVPFSNIQDLSGEHSHYDSLKAQSRKKYKLSPRLAKKSSGKSDRTQDNKGGTSHFYNPTELTLQDVRPKFRVRTENRFLELHQRYGQMIQTRTYSHATSSDLLLIEHF